MRDGSGSTFPEAKGVASDKIRTFSEGIIEGIEEIGSRWRQKVTDMLCQCIDLFPTRILSNLFNVQYNQIP